MLSAGLAAQIPLGSGGDRWRLGAICDLSIIRALTLGWRMAVQFGFVDAGGSSTIQAVGGLTALSIAWILALAAGSTRMTVCR